jgi:NitT/TauT family transport system substrate-binding protein
MRTAIALALCASLTAALPAAAQTAIRYASDWKWEGPSAPFLLALERGYYKEEGLDVTMDTGQGSRESIPRVASGAYQVGFGDFNSLVRFRDQNPDIGVKAVLMVYNNPAFAIVGRRSQGVETPKDLEGRTLGAPAPDAAWAQWNAFVDAAGIDPDKVTVENVGFPVREPMLARGEVDAVAGFSFSVFLNLKAAGVPEDDITVMLMADHGLDMYGNAVFVNPDFAAENPEAVAGFVRATIRGVMDTIADPEAAVEYVLAANDVARREVELERLKLSLAQNFVTAEVEANGFGGIDPERFERSLRQIDLTGAFDGDAPTLEEVFDPSFLPPAGDRQLR